MIPENGMQSTSDKPSGNLHGHKGKHWSFTLIGHDDAYIRKFEDIKEFTTYWVYGKEICPTTKTPHLQCYLVGIKQITRPTMRRWFGDNGSTYAVSFGTPTQNRNYCTKDGDFKEFGMLPQDRSQAGGQSTKDKWVEIVHLSKTKQHVTLLEEHPREFLVHYKNIKQIGFDFSPIPPDLEVPCGEWIYGKTGVGKSYTARKENPGAYIKPMNKWWDFYSGQDCVIIDDMSPDYGKSMEYFFKIWPDCYSFPAEIKNHIVPIRPKKIVVTSQYHPRDIWANEAYDAISRRFHIREIIEMQKNDVYTLKSKKINEIKKKVKKHDKPYMKTPAPKRYINGHVIDNKVKQPKINIKRMDEEHAQVIDLTDCIEDVDTMAGYIADTCSSESINYSITSESNNNDMDSDEVETDSSDSSCW